MSLNLLTVFQSVKILPEEIERYVYEFLPPVEQYRQESIFEKYGFPMYKNMEKQNSLTFVETSYVKACLKKKYPTGYIDKSLWTNDKCFIVPNGTVDDVPIMDRYKEIFKKWSVAQIIDYIEKWFIPADASQPDIHLKILPIFSRKSSVFNYPNDKWTSTFREYESREYEMMRDAVLTNKYRNQCNKRNNIKRRQYRAEWRAFPLTHESHKFSMKQWTDYQIFIDYLYAKDVCYDCSRKWIKNEIKNDGEDGEDGEGEWIMQETPDNKVIYNVDNRGKVFIKVLTCVETGNTLKLKSDPRACNDCAKKQLIKQMKGAAYYF